MSSSDWPVKIYSAFSYNCTHYVHSLWVHTFMLCKLLNLHNNFKFSILDRVFGWTIFIMHFSKILLAMSYCFFMNSCYEFHCFRKTKQMFYISTGRYCCGHWHWPTSLLTSNYLIWFMSFEDSVEDVMSVKDRNSCMFRMLISHVYTYNKSNQILRNDINSIHHFRIMDSFLMLYCGLMHAWYLVQYRASCHLCIWSVCRLQSHYSFIAVREV